MRVFLDTNVLVSAFVSRGLCTEIFELVLLAHDLIVGRNVLRELEKALRVKVRLSAARSTEIIDFVSSEAVQVVDEAEPAMAEADAADARVLGEALAGKVPPRANETTIFKSLGMAVEDIAAALSVYRSATMTL